MRLLIAYLVIDTVNKLLLTRSLDNSAIDSLILNAVGGLLIELVVSNNANEYVGRLLITHA